MKRLDFIKNMREVSLLLFENQCFPKNRVKLISILFLLAIISCKGQNFNIHTMKYFDEKEFESWDFDTRYPFDDELKYLKKGNKRLEILYSYKDKEVQIKEYDTITNYYQWTTYNLETKAQIQTGRTFFNIDYGIWYFYSKTGKLEEKVDMDKDYKFSIFQLIGKIKKEYDRDLAYKVSKGEAYRFHRENRYYYKVELFPLEREYGHFLTIIIDGQTGETLYEKTAMYSRYGSGLKMPVEDYYFKEQKEKQKEKQISPKTTTFQGKTYTEEEWKAFEQEQWEKYQAKRNHKNFWDKLFG